MSEQKETREITLVNKYGLHVRPAGLFAKVASRYDAAVAFKFRPTGDLPSEGAEGLWRAARDAWMLAAEAGLLFAIVAAFFAMFCVFAATGRFAKKGSKEVDDGE